MSNHSKIYFLPVKTITVLVILLLTAGIMYGGFRDKNAVTNSNEDDVINKDSIASVEAFDDVYKVLMHPRCMNCHPKGDIPLQGDDSHLHTMAPRRGKDGHGVYGMKCSNCHQPENTAGLHTPPRQSEMGFATSEHENGFPGEKST
jgi:hypothetical protein